MAQPASLPPRTLEIAVTLVVAVGAGPGSGEVVIPWTVRQIADELELSPGTVQYHLTRLAENGVKAGTNPMTINSDVLIEGRRPPLRLVSDDEPTINPIPAVAPTTDPSPTPQPNTPSTTSEVAIKALDTLAHIADLAATNLPDASNVLTAVVETIGSFGTPEPSTPTGDSCASDCASLREGLREVARGQFAQTSRSAVVTKTPTKKEVKEEVTSSLSVATQTEPRADLARSRAGLREIGTHLRTRDELLILLDPVVQICASEGAPTIESVKGASEAFSVFDDDQLRFAARQLARRLQTTPGAIKVPIGWLISRAIANPPDPHFFPESVPSSELRQVLLDELELDLDLPITQWPLELRDQATDNALDILTATAPDQIAQTCNSDTQMVSRLLSSDYDPTRSALAAWYGSMSSDVWAEPTTPPPKAPSPQVSDEELEAEVLARNALVGSRRGRSIDAAENPRSGVHPLDMLRTIEERRRSHDQNNPSGRT